MEKKGKVILDLEEELDDSSLKEKDLESVTNTIRKMWECYLRMDKEGYSEYLSKDVRRMSQRTRKLQDGKKEVLNGLQKEWEAFERPDNIISEEMTIRNITAMADDESSPSSVAIYYWIEVEGGVRWEYEDQGLVLQIFTNEDDEWKLAHQIDGWSTDYDLDEDDYGEEPTFVFDYVYPVNDLDRAVEFYTPILGKPDFVSDTQAYFGLREPGFILDSSGLFGYAEVKKDLPNGYAIIYVEDLEKETSKLKKNGVIFLENTDSNPKMLANDSMAIAQDTDGNVFVLMEREFSSSKSKTSLNGLDGKSDYILAAKTIAKSWMQVDSKTIAEIHGEDGCWFDNTRSNIRGIGQGEEDISENLDEFYWEKYDKSKDGIAANLSVENLKETTLGDYTIVSYERTLIGNGNHPFKEKAFVTHLFESPDSVLFTFITASTENDGFVVELDYTGHPVSDLEEAEEFVVAITLVHREGAIALTRCD